MYHAVVEGGEDPRASGVKGNAFDAVGFEFKFGQHCFVFVWSGYFCLILIEDDFCMEGGKVFR